jgi:hypothetical protein
MLSIKMYKAIFMPSKKPPHILEFFIRFAPLSSAGDVLYCLSWPERLLVTTVAPAHSVTFYSSVLSFYEFSCLSQGQASARRLPVVANLVSLATDCARNSDGSTFWHYGLAASGILGCENIPTAPSIGEIPENCRGLVCLNRGFLQRSRNHKTIEAAWVG